LAFDGANIWVGQYYGGIVKLRASDGAILGTFDVGSALAMAFDGANIWAVSAFGNIVTKLRASDGTILGTYTVGDHS
jgi:outer membrane protein assembly factor BamB